MANQKTILITGASSGIGKATALQLLSEGHIVYGAARRVEAMQDLVEAGGHALAMDITDVTQMRAAVARVMQEQGAMHVLINNAGYGLYGAVEDISIDEARQQFEVNLFGLAAITKEVMPHMRNANSGTIINVSSMGGQLYTPLGAWYHATKHALEGWSDCLRLELAQFGIRVVIIQPGAIATEFGDRMSGPMVQRSGNGPYGKIAAAMAEASRETYEKKGAASPPSVIAVEISRAIRAKRPKTRYVAGKLARPLLFFRKYFSDRLYDYAIMNRVR